MFGSRATARHTVAVVVGVAVVVVGCSGFDDNDDSEHVDKAGDSQIDRVVRPVVAGTWAELVEVATEALDEKLAWLLLVRLLATCIRGTGLGGGAAP